MGMSLTIRSKLLSSSAKPYRLDLRHHGAGGTDYSFVCSLEERQAVALLSTGVVRFLFSPPEGLPERAAAMPRSVLEASWDATVEGEKHFRLAVTPLDGSKAIELAMVDYEVADAVVDTGMAKWAAIHPALDEAYLRSETVRRAEALRTEADRLMAAAP